MKIVQSYLAAFVMSGVVGPSFSAFAQEKDGSVVLNDATGIDAEIHVVGIQAQDEKSQICYAHELPNEPSADMRDVTGVGCVPLPAQETDARFGISNLPLSTRIFVFHDKNNNGKLDFTVFNVLVDRRESIAEGYAFVEDPNSISTEPLVRRHLFLSPGVTQIETALTYRGTALEEFVVEKAWQEMLNRLRTVSQGNHKYD